MLHLHVRQPRPSHRLCSHRAPLSITRETNHAFHSSRISFPEAFLARDILLVLRVLKDPSKIIYPAALHRARYTCAAPRARPASRVPCRRVRPPPRHRVEVPDLRCETEIASVRGPAGTHRVTKRPRDRVSGLRLAGVAGGAGLTSSRRVRSVRRSSSWRRTSVSSMRCCCCCTDTTWRHRVRLERGEACPLSTG